MYLTKAQAASRHNVKTGTIDRWALAGCPFVTQPRVGRLYLVEDIDRYAALMRARSRVGKGRPKGARNKPKSDTAHTVTRPTNTEDQ
nr:hypothetical protein [Gordonia sp. NB41Y]